MKVPLDGVRMGFLAKFNKFREIVVFFGVF